MKKNNSRSGGVINKSQNKYNILYKELYKLDFLKQEGNYTVSEITELIKLVFPNFRSRTQYKVSINMIAHCFERLSRCFAETSKKECKLNLLVIALKECSFELKEEIMDNYPNVSIVDFNLINEIIRRIK